MYMAQDRRALQRVIKTTQNIIGTHLLSINDISEVRCLHRAHRILKDNTSTQKYLLPYCQTTEQLLSSGYETPPFILHAPP